MRHDHLRDHVTTGTPHPSPLEPAAVGVEPEPSARWGGWATAWSAVTVVIAAIAGLAPHILHHISLVAGAVLVTGATGNLLFGGLGLLLSVPLLRRLYRRFRSWKAPAVALVLFAVMFSLSSFLIGPAINGGADESRDPSPAPSVSPDEHAEHHE